MITLTDDAAKAIERFMRAAEHPVVGLRILIQGGGCSGFQYTLRMEQEKQADDTELNVGGVTLLIDPMSYTMVDGLSIDFIDSLTHTGFKFDNPNATAHCGCGRSFTL